MIPNTHAVRQYDVVSPFVLCINTKVDACSIRVKDMHVCSGIIVPNYNSI